MNLDSIIFIGGPLDRKYMPAEIKDQVFKYSYEKDKHFCEVIYTKIKFPWKKNKQIEVMMLEGLPSHYYKIIEQSFIQGIKDDLSLGSVILCLPKLKEPEKP